MREFSRLLMRFASAVASAVATRRPARKTKKLIRASEEIVKDSGAGAPAHIAVARSPWTLPEARTLLARRLPSASTSAQQFLLGQRRAAAQPPCNGHARILHDPIRYLGRDSRWHGFHRARPSVLSFLFAPEVERLHSMMHLDRRLRRSAKNKQVTVKS